ncbi:MAG: hypothetical protein IT210_09955 [Armatimonadetes bacterium]|nr:hypothetical protein [Armatimonadota bacterium]
MFPLLWIAMGLALSTPIKNTTAVIGTFIGIVFFAEWKHTAPVPAFVSSLLIVACAIILGTASDATGTRSRVNAPGVAWAISASVFFASYTIPMKLSGALSLDTHTLMAWMAFGIPGTLLAIFVGMRRPFRAWAAYPIRDHSMAALSGWIWYLAVLVMLGGIRRIGLAVTWPVSNLNTIVTVLVGIWAFHEVDMQKHRGKIYAGLLAGALGVILLGLSKSGGH